MYEKSDPEVFFDQIKSWVLSTLLLVLLSNSASADSKDIFASIPKIEVVVNFPDIGRRVENVVHSVGHSIETAAQDVGDTVEKAGHDVGDTVEKAGHDVGHAAEVAISDIGYAAEKAAHDVGHATEKALADLGQTTEKAWADTLKANEKAIRDVLDLGVATKNYTKRTFADRFKTYSDAERRVIEGKILDANWHLMVDPLKAEEKNSALATQESVIIEAIGQTAATSYFGPYGAAAYASWLTYRKTGDAELALKIGILTGSTAGVLDGLTELPTDPEKLLALRAVTAGAIGGLAVAAAGGDSDDVRNAFLRAGGMVIIREAYRDYVGAPMNGKASVGPPYCIMSSGADCSPPDSAYLRKPNGDYVVDSNNNKIVDITKTNLEQPHVGLATSVGDCGFWTECGPFMIFISKIPGMNAMSIYHDKFTLEWNLSPFMTRVTIIPAVLTTYSGMGAPFYSQLVELGVDSGPPRTPIVNYISPANNTKNHQEFGNSYASTTEWDGVVFVSPSVLDPSFYDPYVSMPILHFAE
jgi:hypothetical protein